ncbi:MAG: SPFH domain-containing protein [Acidobacteriota bacterium]|nr:SPFH domain-containing protein [Blastocatellia bacterium]MDW8412108.1 SPFH domain-containing protein [Acidobacteriota bacterium]
MSNKKIISITVAFVLVISLVVIISRNLEYAEEGTVKVLTQWGSIKRIYKPSDGWFLTLLPGQRAYEVNLRSFTETATPRVTSKDNAALQVPISVTAATDPNKVEEYLRKFGFDQNERYKRRNEILSGLVQTEARNAFAEYGAYEIYANQEAIQKRIIESLRPLLANQLFLQMESVQIGNPDFLDDRIEQAASAVVANEKQKQAEEARLAAAEVAAKTKQIEAQTYSNPALFEIRKLELLLEIENARAEGIKNHQGPLTIVYGSETGVQLQVPTR